MLKARVSSVTLIPNRSGDPTKSFNTSKNGAKSTTLDVAL
jgi:hypothetical protein